MLLVKRSIYDCDKIYYLMICWLDASGDIVANGGDSVNELFQDFFESTRMDSWRDDKEQHTCYLFCNDKDQTSTNDFN